MQGAAFGFFHDMAITEHYYIVFQNPTRLDAKKLLTEYMFAKVQICYISNLRLLHSGHCGASSACWLCYGQRRLNAGSAVAQACWHLPYMGTHGRLCALLQCSIAECITFDRKLNMRIHLIPRPGRPHSDVQAAQQVWYRRMAAL